MTGADRLLTVLNQCEVWRSLDAGSYSMALRRTHRVAAEGEAGFEKAGRTIGEVHDRFTADPKPRRSKSNANGTILVGIDLTKAAGPVIGKTYIRNPGVEQPKFVNDRAITATPTRSFDAAVASHVTSAISTGTINEARTAQDVIHTRAEDWRIGIDFALGDTMRIRVAGDHVSMVRIALRTSAGTLGRQSRRPAPPHPV